MQFALRWQRATFLVKNAYLKSLHERLRPTLRDGSEVIDKVSLRHANTCITDGQDVILSVCSDGNGQVFSGVQLAWISEALITDLIYSLHKRKVFQRQERVT